MTVARATVALFARSLNDLFMRYSGMSNVRDVSGTGGQYSCPEMWKDDVKY